MSALSKWDKGILQLILESLKSKINYCDSCTEEREVKAYKAYGDTFYWCADCNEENND
jgi:hypothetical protein